MHSSVGEGTAEVAKIDDTKPPAQLARVVAPLHPYEREETCGGFSSSRRNARDNR